MTSGVRALATARLTAAGLPAPRSLVTADEVKHGKPAPDAYLAGAAALSLAPDRTIVIEDAPPGITAVRAAGAGLVIGIGQRARATDADLVLPDLTGVTWRDGSAEGARGKTVPPTLVTARRARRFAVALPMNVSRSNAPVLRRSRETSWVLKPSAPEVRAEDSRMLRPVRSMTDGHGGGGSASSAGCPGLSAIAGGP